MILDVLTGNRDAYAVIVRRYETKVRGYCRTVLRDATAAEDAAQEVFIKAYQALGQFQGNSSFSTWIYRIAANCCTDIVRKAARRKTESWEALVERDGDKMESTFSVLPDKNRVGHEELVDQLFAALPEKSREVLYLREMQGLSYQELAESLDCTVDAVRARLKRARQEAEIKLRHLLRG